MPKDITTGGATTTLFVHLGVLFFVIFPVGFIVLLLTKFFIGLLFNGFEMPEAADGTFWMFAPAANDPELWRLETCTLMNCMAAFVALVVFVIRALLKMGELPNLVNGIITLYVRLSFRMIALPILTVLVCTITSLAIYFVFASVDDFEDTYFSLSMIVLLPTVIGMWIWVWRGAWITSIEQAGTSQESDLEPLH